MTELRREDIRFEPSSVVDPVGTVFHFNGRVFRAINAPYAAFFDQAIEVAKRTNLFERGLVPTWKSEYSLPGYASIIEHKRIPFITLRGEWSCEGLRAAALCILNVSAELLRASMCLKDAHPWNVLFDGTQPYFIDWGSVRPADELNWEFWYGQFRQYLLAPLHAFSIGEPRIARAMLREHRIGVGNEIIFKGNIASLPEVARQIAEGANNAPTPETFEALAQYVSSLELPEIQGEWVGYAQPKFTTNSELTLLREKDRIVHRVLQEDRGQTLIDIGTNNGLHSEIAASFGKRVLACDIEEACLNALFSRTRQHRSDILPLYYDFLWPIGTSGILNTIPAAEDRLACDTVMLMAVTHHLAFKQGVSFEAIALGASRLTRHRAVIEFVPPEDEHVALWSPERLPWYNMDNFLIAMRRYFRTHIVIPSDPSPRCIIVFEK